MTVQDLLHKYLDYHTLWNGVNASKKPVKIRLQQIDALLDAFGLSKKYVNPLIQVKYGITGQKEELSRSQKLKKMSNIEYLYSGEFLQDRPKEKNEEIEQIAYEKVKELFPKIPEKIMENKLHLGWMYNRLINFRIETYRLGRQERGMLEGFSVGVYYSMYVIENVKKLLRENLDELDNTICLILDPDKQEISLETLIKKYKYPDEDLEKIDHEWRVENY